MVLSFVLLLLSTIDPGPFGFIVRLCWLASFLALVLVNIGAALAAYIGSLAIYSPLRVEGWSSLMQRPDNYAAPILFVAMLMMVPNRREAGPRLAPYVLAILVYCVLNTALLSPTQFPAIIRHIAIPLLACLLLAMIRLREREFNAMLIGMGIMGAYAGFVSILEGCRSANWILPPWIGDRSVIPYDEWIIGATDPGQAGGTILYPAWNGLFLSLVFVAMLFHRRKNGSRLAIITMVLCAAGCFFTYERSVWLGLALALLWFPGWCRSSRQANWRRIALVCFLAVLLIGAKGMASERLQNSDTVLYRFALWGAGLRLFMAHPVVGIGFFNFGAASANVQQGFANMDYRDVTDQAASHNTILTVLVELGIIGFLFYGMAFVKTFQSAAKNALHRWGRSGKAWVVAFAIVYLINAQFISAFEGTTNTLFCAFLGAVAGAEDNSGVIR